MANDPTVHQMSFVAEVRGSLHRAMVGGLLLTGRLTPPIIRSWPSTPS